jgi:uncharacterized membrane protein
MKTNRGRTLFLAQFSLLLAIEAIFCFTPLGSIPFTPVIVATTAMIPVAIAGIVMGPRAGTAMGFFAGLFSFLIWTFMPPNPLMAFAFTPFYSLGEISGNAGSLLICFVPRVLVGTVAGLVSSALAKKYPSRDALAYAIAGALGSLTNTLLVMGGIWLFFGKQYETMASMAMLSVVGLTVLTNGLPELAVSAIAAAAVCKPLKIFLSKRGQ